MAALGLCCCMLAFSSFCKRELLSRCGVQASHCGGFSSRRAHALECGLLPLRCMGLVVQQHVEFSQTRGQTHVTCTGRQILNHWTTREVLT